MTKAVVFDMDGTLLRVNSWEELHRAYGLDDTEDRTMLRWYQDGILDYPAWTDLIVRIYMARGRATQENAMAAFDRYSLDPAAQDVVDEVHRRGLRTLLLSGGIDELVSRVAGALGIQRFVGNHNMRFGPEGNFVGFEIRGDDRTFKVEQLAAFCAEQDLAPSDCVCVGDGCNDAGIFELTGHGVLLCPPDRSPPFKNYWRRAARLEDLITYLPPGVPI
jgi:phosphoserine phosphatase